MPVEKTAERLEPDEGRLVSDRRNMVFRGTSVVYGRGTAIVTETGMATALGQIAGLLQAHSSPPTPLQRQLSVLGRRIAAAAVAACAVIFLVGIARGEPAGLMFFTAVSLAVAAIPESLPAVVTVSMALGAQRMARRHALIRKLSAVETLGSVTVIASDKTGTLTEGRMVAERVWTRDETFTIGGTGYEPSGGFANRFGPVDPGLAPPLTLTLRTVALCNDAALVAPEGPSGRWTMVGDPTEAALVALAAKGGLSRSSLAETHPRIAEIAFDSGRRRMTTVHSVRDDDGLIVAVKGAVEAVLPIVTTIVDRSGVRSIRPDDFEAVGDAVEGFGRDGYRVLAVAGRRTSTSDGGEFERDLTLYGLVAIADPPRASSAAAVRAAREAGITPLMVTGDHAQTAAAIAREVGILQANDQVVTGRELTESVQDDLVHRVEDIAVYARTSPEQKLDIVAAWQVRGAVVAMTGDGVNDAPALRKADIGIAMGITGTEVSREAADMVLADDNFATIVGAIREGRRIYDNIRRSVRFGLTGGTAEVWLIFLAPFIGLPLPLLPIQILWVNLVTHGLPGVALAVEPAEPDVLQRAPRPRTEGILSGGLWQRILVDGLLLGLICLGLGAWAFATGRPWQTMVFTSLALLQLGNALALRSDRESVFRLGWGRNPFLLAVLAGTLVLQLALIYLPIAQELLSTQPLSLADLVVVLVVSTAMFWVVEFQKSVHRRRTHPREPSSYAERCEP
jgi:Ca2+-transporting ATPase